MLKLFISVRLNPEKFVEGKRSHV